MNLVDMDYGDIYEELGQHERKPTQMNLVDMDYGDIYEELGQLINDDVVHEKVAQLVMKRLGEAYTDGKRVGHIEAADNLRSVWEFGTDKIVDISLLDRDIYADINESIQENPGSTVPRSPRENLECYLSWNGIIGYTEHIIRAVHSIERALSTERVLP